MKEYIFVAFNPCIYGGGGEAYVTGKIRYLETHGWKVHAFFSLNPTEKNFLSDMASYMKGGLSHGELSLPPYRRRKWEQNYILEQLCSQLNTTDGDRDEIIVESVEDIVSYWAELLAARIHARHIFVPCNEYYRAPNQTYEENLDFYYFKWKRKEFFAHPSTIKHFFNGYKGVETLLGEIPGHVCPEPEPVQDVWHEAVEKMEMLDWNICHLGRGEKIYVPDVIKAVARFARLHPDKSIQFVFVGDVECRKELLLHCFQNIKNVRFVYLGFLHPIPRALFKKLDVIIAISQSAVFCAEQGVPTIVASNNGDGTVGVLGFDTLSNVPGKDEQLVSYESVLNDVLVEHRYEKSSSVLPKRKKNDVYYEQFIKIARNASLEKEYYDERLSTERVKTGIHLFPYAKVPPDSRVVLYGAGQVGRDFKKQLELSHYCKLIGVVDTNYNDYDFSVQSPELLKTWDYDYIVISVALVKMADEIRRRLLDDFQIEINRIVFDCNYISSF